MQEDDVILFACAYFFITDDYIGTCLWLLLLIFPMSIHPYLFPARRLVNTDRGKSDFFQIPGKGSWIRCSSYTLRFLFLVL